MAATLVKAEQKAELAEFDETIPWDEREAEARKEEEEMSRAEMELAMLDKEVRDDLSTFWPSFHGLLMQLSLSLVSDPLSLCLTLPSAFQVSVWLARHLTSYVALFQLTPIERYAVGMMEAQMEDEVAEELKMAEVLCGLDRGLTCRSILFCACIVGHTVLWCHFCWIVVFLFVFCKIKRSFLQMLMKRENKCQRQNDCQTTCDQHSQGMKNLSLFGVFLLFFALWTCPRNVGPW